MDHYCASPSKKLIGRGTLLSSNQASTICLRAATCRKFVTEIAYGRLANVKLRKWRNAQRGNLDVAPCRCRKREFRLVDAMRRGCEAPPICRSTTPQPSQDMHLRCAASDQTSIYLAASTEMRSTAITFSATSRVVARRAPATRVQKCELQRIFPAAPGARGRPDIRDCANRWPRVTDAERASAPSVANYSSVGAIAPAPKRGKLAQICGRSDKPGGRPVPAGG